MSAEEADCSSALISIKLFIEAMDIECNIQKIKSELPSGVKLVAVSKFHPVEALREAYDAGQRLFGESRPQEMRDKVQQMPGDVQWHFIGHLQKNKLKYVLPYVAMLESVDSVELLDAIEQWCSGHPGFRAAGAEDSGNGEMDSVTSRVNVLLECHIAREETKQGFTPEEALAVLTGEARWPHIRFCGLMGMATNTDDESVIRSDFSKLLAMNASLQPMVGICPNLTQDFRELSFGMSDDYKIAASMGATIVRIGTLIFGEREYCL